MQCPRCGHENEPAANFCSSCAAPLNDDDPTTNLAGLIDLLEADEFDADVSEILAGIPDGIGVLIVTHGPNKGSRYALDDEVSTLGRASDSTIFLDDVSVSRRHASVHRHADGYDLRDRGSLNGTYVNGERIDNAPLHHLAEIRIGTFVLVFLLPGSPA
jgi:FHA domain/zinc-ribbon domain